MMRWRDQSGPSRQRRTGTPGLPWARESGGGRRPTIAVLLDALRGSYQSTVLSGIADAADRRDVNLVVLAGGVLGAPGTDKHRNFAFELCNNRTVDGAVLLGGALGNHLGPDAVAAICSRLAPLPLVSLSIALPDVPSLLLDEDPGMRQALEHILVRHGRRRIAFVRGPAVNAEAERRFAVYRTVLAEHGIDLDPALVCDGNFQKSAGEAAVATLLDERKVSFDALVAANDYMALAAIPALIARGLHVPGDVAVVGFDDIEDARFATPPLTTVRQPLYQQGEIALDLVLAQLQGAEVAPRTTAVSELVVRQSCGCFLGLARPGRAGPVTMTETPLETLLGDHGEELRQQVARAVRGADTALPEGWDRQLLDAFEAELRGAGAGLFTATLDRWLMRVAGAGDDVGAWHGMVSALRRLLLPSLPNEPLRWVQAEDLWHEARILIGDMAERAQAQHRLYSERLAQALNEGGATLLATQQVSALTGAVVRQLPKLEIPGAWMALFDSNAPAPIAGTATLVIDYDAERAQGNDPAASGGSAGAASTPLADARNAIIPQALERLTRRASLVLEPLFFRERPLGCLLMELGPRDGIVYESLAEQVSSALEGARLVALLVDEATRRQIAERQRLEKEMEIAAHIQTSILPRDIDVPGLEIAAAMQPATEVGGDYYDVVPVHDGCWIGIGDVAGHGLPTGLVMLMIQSGIAALARTLPDATPRELLLALNTMLFENVRTRMEQHEHATLTLLRYRRDGSLVFAGAHEEILIRRAATGRCERIETPGTWVGAKRDISAGIVDSQVALRPGDVLVLYTDGITEAAAASRDAGTGAASGEQERFGMERLVAAIEKQDGSSATAIRDGILAALGEFAARREDDVTLLVARYF